MTAGDIITDARMALNDPSAVRWTNAASMYLYILDGESLIADLHPESQYISHVTNSTPTLSTATTDVLTIGADWKTALVHYVAYRCFLEDSDAAGNAKLSAQHYQLFREAVK